MVKNRVSELFEMVRLRDWVCAQMHGFACFCEILSKTNK